MHFELLTSKVNDVTIARNKLERTNNVHSMLKAVS